MSTLQLFAADTFGAEAFWVMDEDVAGKVLYRSATRYRWEDIECIQDWPTPSPYSEELTPAGPKCILLYGDNEVKIMAPFLEVCAAWEKYRIEAAGQKTGLHFIKSSHN